MFFKIFFKVKAFGRENFPKNGALIVASNHVSFLDPVAVGVVSPRKLNFMARSDLFNFKPFGKLLGALNTFPLKRFGRDLNAFRIALHRLSKGEALMIFPEGTRSEDGALREPQRGIGLLEDVSGAKILPCYVKGSEKALPRGARFFKRHPVSIHFGKVLEFDREILRSKRKERYMYVAQTVMQAIAELKKNTDTVVSLS